MIFNFKNGFTLIEIMVCISVILILVVFTIPIIKEAKTNAKIGQVKENLLTIRNDLEHQYNKNDFNYPIGYNVPNAYTYTRKNNGRNFTVKYNHKIKHKKYSISSNNSMINIEDLFNYIYIANNEDSFNEYIAKIDITGKEYWRYPIDFYIIRKIEVNEDLYLGLDSGEILRIDSEGNNIWHKQPSTRRIETIEFKDNYIYITTYDKLYQINKKTGTINWEFNPEDSIVGDSLTNYNSKILFATRINNGDKTLYCLDKEGNKLWNYRKEMTNINRDIKINNNYIYTCFSNCLIKFDINGNVLWEYTPTKIGEHLNGNLVIKDDKIYLPLTNDIIKIINPETKEAKKEIDVFGNYTNFVSSGTERIIHFKNYKIYYYLPFEDQLLITDNNWGFIEEKTNVSYLKKINGEIYYKQNNKLHRLNDWSIDINNNNYEIE